MEEPLERPSIGGKMKELLQNLQIEGRLYTNGEVLFMPGDPSDQGIGLIVGGLVDVRRSKDDFSIITQLGVGQFVGILAVLGVPHQVCATSRANDTRVVWLSIENLNVSLSRQPTLLVQMVKHSINLLRQIPPGLIEMPDQEIQIENVFNAEIAGKFIQIQAQNLRIRDVLHNYHTELVYPLEKLFSTGDAEDEFIYLLLSGTILQQAGPLDDPRTIITLTPGSLFGFFTHMGGGHILRACAGPDSVCRLIQLEPIILYRIAAVDRECAMSIFSNAVLTIALVEKLFIKPLGS